jgi:hypothetical protein
MRRCGGADLQGLVATNHWRDPRSAARYAHVVAHEEWGRVEKLPAMPIASGGKICGVSLIRTQAIDLIDPGLLSPRSRPHLF